MSKIRRVLAGTLAASALVVGGLGVGNAWAKLATSPTASHDGSSASNADHHGSDDCPHHDDSNASSSTASLSL